MATRKVYKIIIVLIIALFAIFLAWRAGDEKREVQYQSNTNSISISATIIAGEKTVNLSLPLNSTLYEGLLVAQKSGQIEFSGKNYSGLGFFTTKIGPLQSGGGKYLFYYINGKEASVGVSSYILQNGDVVLWKLK